METLADSAGTISLGPESIVPNGQLLTEQGASTGISVGQIDGIPAGNVSPGSIAIGENMTDRVVPFAESIGADYYVPTQSISEVGMQKALENNADWFIGKLNAGYRVYDLGIDVNRARSVFYSMEDQTAMEWSSTTGKTILYGKIK